MNSFLLIHTHRHGTSTYFFRSTYRWDGIWNSGTDGDAELEELTDALVIDFEPDKDETIEILDITSELARCPLIRKKKK